MFRRSQFFWRRAFGRLGVADVEATFEHQRVVAVKLDGVKSRRWEDEADEVEDQFDDGVNVGELDGAVDVGDGVVGFFVDDAEACVALAATFRERDENAELWMPTGEAGGVDVIEDADEGFFVGEFVLDDLVADDDGEAGGCGLGVGH